MTGALPEHLALFLVQRIVLLILGILAVVVPPLATLAFTAFLRWLFVISGSRHDVPGTLLKSGVFRACWLLRPGFS
jgi:uncharacterized membrane protein HdeD (DUF308 family)